jgi:hypothetical protein
MTAKKAKNNQPRRVRVVSEGVESAERPNADQAVRQFFSGGKKTPTKLDRVNRRKIPKLWLAIGGIAILLIVAAIGFYTLRGGQFTGDQVEIIFRASDKVSSGDTITIKVDYANNEAVSLGNVSLNMQFPEGFTVEQTSMEPANNVGSSWDLGTLNRGERGNLVITGQLVGEVGTDKKFLARLVYKPADFNATFESSEEFSVNIASSIVDLSLEGPVRVAPETEATYTLSYTSTSDTILENIVLEPQWPDNFNLISSQPELNENKRWLIERLTKSEEGTITFAGSFTGGIGDTTELVFEVSLTDAEGFSEKQLTYTQLILLVGGELSLEFTVNSSAKDIVIKHGATLDYKLVYSNTTEFVLEDNTFMVHFDEKVLDYDKLLDARNGRRDGQTITWDKEVISDLASLKPGDEGEIVFSLPIRDDLSIDSDKDVNFSVVATAEGSVGSVVDGVGLIISVPTSTREAKISSTFELLTEGRYYAQDGTKVGSGPLPPQVGAKTTYRLYFELSNNSNDVRDVKVTTVLPDDVIWVNDSALTAGTITYNNETRMVNWTINQIPAGSGYYRDTLKANFAVSITPSASDVGELMLLSDVIEASGSDSYSQKGRKDSASKLTTELTNDPLAKGKGLVVE